MNTFFLNIYDYLQKHRRLCMGLLFASFGLLLLMTTSLRYNENIYDFLPLSGNEQKAISLYQDISGSKKLFVIFQMKDAKDSNSDCLAQAVDTFTVYANKGKGKKHIKELTSQVDYSKIASIADLIYENVPLLLTADDYDKMEKNLSNSAFIDEQLSNDVQMMMMPSTGMFSSNIGNDPLSLFNPILERLYSRQQSLPFDIDNGYIYTQDRKCALAMITTPYGAVESANNALLMDYIDSVRTHTMKSVSNVDVEVTGAPVIAVDNAQQIKKDSFLAIAISVTLILALLVFSFRSFKDLLLIGFAIIFGWLFALGCIANTGGNVSLIVLGIGSIIIGIAVNYPLHFVAHVAHESTVRDVLKDMVSPLLIGNITTVGAFAALIPLDAPALRDLGLFAVFMLVGTILFVLVFLPHLISRRQSKREERLSFGRLAEKSPERCKWILPVILVGTLLFGYYSFQTSFDANMHNINYMTPTQERLMTQLQSTMQTSDSSCVYIVTEGKTWDEALSARERLNSKLDSLVMSKQVESYSDVSQYVCSEDEQQRRIVRWNNFWNKHRDEVKRQISMKSSQYGFSDDAFSGFFDIITKNYSVQPFEHFEQIKATLLPNSFSSVEGRCSVVDVLQVSSENIEKVKSTINEALNDHGYAFDFIGMNSAMANSLSDNFNYIGYACSVIVFVFLWLSFGRLELSLLAFLPMALGWIWILGMMQVLDMRFNIVNIILATFIFGQGDDYTIFMADGLINEYAYKRKLLLSYKNSIVISALIMFIGMGSLIVAKHPALHSLAEVTIVGMFTVVLMAWIVPPIIFRWIVSTNGIYRRFPVTIEQIARTSYGTIVYLLQLCYGSVLGFLIAYLPGNKTKREHWFHRLICKSMRYDINHISGLKPFVKNEGGENFKRGSIIICNHQSILDPIYLLALNPHIILLVGAKVWRNPLVNTMFRFARFINVAQPIEKLKQTIKTAVDDGYSVAIFPEACRSSDGRIKRFHKGAFYIARELGVDVLPIFLHGTGLAMPKGSGFASHGQVTVEVGKRISTERLSDFGETDLQIAHNLHRLYIERYDDMRRRIENSHYFHHAIIYNYIYKGYSVERETKQMLRRYNDFSKWIDESFDLVGKEDKTFDKVVIINSGKGQFALLFALVHPNIEVRSYAFNDDDATLAACCQYLPSNLHIFKSDNFEKTITEISKLKEYTLKTYLLFPDSEMKVKSASVCPIIVE